MRLSTVSVLAGLVLAWALTTPAAEPGWRVHPLPPDAEQLNQQAEAAEHPADAIRLHAQSLRLFPSNGPALYGLGRALLEQGRISESIVVFRRLNQFFPGEAVALEALAAALARLPAPRRAEIQEGADFAAEATRLQPEAPEGWHVLSVLRHLAGDYAGAAEAARRAVELDAQTPVDVETTALYQQQETACNDALLVFSPVD
jgi:tetratricopeptide (TPR) repeat protein